VTRWTPAGGYQLFDKGKRHLGVWGSQEYVIYGMTRADGSNDLVWGNAKTGEKEDPGQRPQPLPQSRARARGQRLGGHGRGRQRLLLHRGRQRSRPVVKKLATHTLGAALRVGTLGETIVAHWVSGELTIYKLP